jgi:hypothetical protein
MVATLSKQAEGSAAMTNLKTHASIRMIAYWAPTLVIFAAFLGSGIALLTSFKPMIEGMAHLGYPAYFTTLLGIWKVLGATAIVAPGLPLVKEWAYAGIMFDLTGAVISRLVVGDGGMDAILPMIFIVATVASWLLRPEGRRLAGAQLVTLSA